MLCFGSVRERTAMARRGETRNQSLLTRAVVAVFAFVRQAEFEILFFLFFFIAYLLFKDITSRPEYNQLFVKRPGGPEFWPF
ncbi:unnamed protein product [Sphenostylis stenocarpa]|uniref:Uncharacterized protein n=1 Tax=Sphenostylis stenocarpa TaxID=92480 RepID=A0AA86VZ43_9FABA|nr:unnamed protein product [Sphenostylis stenocarpa]